jgi:hypothetical protein
MDAEGAAPSPGGADGGSDPVVLILTQQQAAAMAALIPRSEGHEPWLDIVRNRLQSTD